MDLREVSIDIEIESARQEPPELPVPARPEPTRLFLVRHGQSTWNQEHRIQGQLDPPLSDEGRRQARRLGQRLAGRHFVAAYASDLKRALQTAELIGEAIGIEPIPLASLREIYLGGWEGLNTEEMAQRYPDAWAAWAEEPSWDVVPDGEGSRPFEARVSEAIDAILARHPQGDVLVVTHGGVIQVALHRIVGRPNHGLFPFRIQNASLSLIERRDGRMVVGGVNDIGHLDPDPSRPPLD